MSKPPYLGLDIGMRRTGVALSENGMLATPLLTVEWMPPHAASLIQSILELVREHETQTIIVGIPLGEDDEPTGQAAKTEHIVTQLAEALTQGNLPCELIRVNEFASTVDGQIAYPDADRDSAAAALLLQDYLDTHA